MVDQQPELIPPHASSTGGVLANVDWLDIHFEACSLEYTLMLHSVGLQAGWHVLDAGCGSGSYLPLLAEIVGAAGHITALDLMPENIAIVEQRLKTWKLPCPVSVEIGSLSTLPYPDQHFDALWSSNVTQYFSDAELSKVLAEFRRVVRPGGLVAIKDVDMQLMRVYPAPPFLVSHLSEVSIRDGSGSAQSQGSLRGRELRRWLEHAGFERVWQRTTVIERWSPLRTVERQLFVEWLAYLAFVAEERGVPETDLVLWRSVRDPTSSGHLVDHPDFYACEGQVVAAGYRASSEMKSE